REGARTDYSAQDTLPMTSAPRSITVLQAAALTPENRKSMTTNLITPAESFAERTDVLIIGSGAAGLPAAQTIVEADPTPSVTVITRGEPADSSTAWAQGG